MRVLVYDDGVHNNDILFHRLTRSFGVGNVMRCHADDIISGILSYNVTMLVMPGGADLHYCRQLNGAGNLRIAAAVERGMLYLGICAGMYYGSERVLWGHPDMGMEQIAGPRELGFFPGAAIGPILRHGDMGGAWKYLKYVGRGSEKYPVYYAGGPVPTPRADAKPGSFNVILTDEEGRPDFIECPVGRGFALMTTSHYEHSFRQMAASGYPMPPRDHNGLDTLVRHFMQAADNAPCAWDILVDRVRTLAPGRLEPASEKRLQIV